MPPVLGSGRNSPPGDLLPGLIPVSCIASIGPPAHEKASPGEDAPGKSISREREETLENDPRPASPGGPARTTPQFGRDTWGRWIRRNLRPRVSLDPPSARNCARTPGLEDRDPRPAQPGGEGPGRNQPSRCLWAPSGVKTPCRRRGYRRTCVWPQPPDWNGPKSCWTRSHARRDADRRPVVVASDAGLLRPCTSGRKGSRGPPPVGGLNTGPGSVQRPNESRCFEGRLSETRSYLGEVARLR